MLFVDHSYQFMQNDKRWIEFEIHLNIYYAFSLKFL